MEADSATLEVTVLKYSGMTVSFRNHLLISHMLSLKMYDAKNGDAFLINAGGKHLLIDAGFASTYQGLYYRGLDTACKYKSSP